MNNYLHPALVEPGNFYSSQIPAPSPPARSFQSISTVSENLPLDPRLVSILVLVPRRNVITKIKLVIKFNCFIVISLILLDLQFCSLHLIS